MTSVQFSPYRNDIIRYETVTTSIKSGRSGRFSVAFIPNENDGAAIKLNRTSMKDQQTSLI